MWSSFTLSQAPSLSINNQTVETLDIIFIFQEETLDIKKFQVETLDIIFTHYINISRGNPGHYIYISRGKPGHYIYI